MRLIASTYLKAAEDLYRDAALTPQVGLCCTTSPVWHLPGLSIPPRMLAMNYGCGSTVHPRDLTGSPTMLYVGVGGGLELLQFAYFSRRPGSIIGLDVVTEMIDACRDNLKEAERANPWFRQDYVDLRTADARALPLADESVDVAAQNCLFNIFQDADLDRALAEMYRVLRPRGRLLLSDPVCDSAMPQELCEDPQLRAMCLSGARPLSEYIRRLTSRGFGTIEVRARRPYRVLSPRHFRTPALITIDSVEICAIKDPMPADGPCVFTGRTAIYHGNDEILDDGKGHILSRNQPLAVCDKTANALARLGRDDIYLSASTYFYDGGGCC
jgi:ubiquinone/menaquinone biosynthesis C-methylase UbiE